MSRIPTEVRGKRPNFFPEAGTDELVSMLLELTSELWVVKERLYALEKVADQAGLNLSGRIEGWRPSEKEGQELDEARAALLANLLRSTKARHVPSAHLRRALDASMGNGDEVPNIPEVGEVAEAPKASRPRAA